MCGSSFYQMLYLGEIVCPEGEKKPIEVKRCRAIILISLICNYLSLSINRVRQVKTVPSTMLSSLWGGSASSSKYTQLSDLEGSTVPPKYGMLLRFLKSGHRVSFLLRRTVCGTAKMPPFLIPLDAHGYSRAMPLSNYL